MRPALCQEALRLGRILAELAATEPEARGLALADALTTEPTLKDYHLLPSVRGDLLAKLGRCDEAREEFSRAASLTRNARERTLLLQRAAACTREPEPPTAPPGDVPG